jgi:hypothetical protein
MDYTYLSKIEAGLVAPPAEDKIRMLARVLGRTRAEADELVGLAQRTRVPTEVVKAAIIRNPEVGALLRKIAQRPDPRLTEREAQIIRSATEALGGEQEGQGDGTSAG